MIDSILGILLMMMAMILCYVMVLFYHYLMMVLLMIWYWGCRVRCWFRYCLCTLWWSLILGNWKCWYDASDDIVCIGIQWCGSWCWVFLDAGIPACRYFDYAFVDIFLWYAICSSLILFRRYICCYCIWHCTVCCWWCYVFLVVTVTLPLFMMICVVMLLLITIF